MSKYAPLTKLHKLVQLTHSANGKAIFYSQVHLVMNDSVDEDEVGGWIMSAFTGKSYFEREYRRDELDDLLTSAGDDNWESFSNRFKDAVVQGYFHMTDTNPRECTVIIDNNIQSRDDSLSTKVKSIEIEMYPVNHASRSEKIGEFMFECATFIQKQGCSLSSSTTTVRSNTSISSSSTSQGPSASLSTNESMTGVLGASGGKSYEALKAERDTYKAENAALRQELEKLRANQMSQGMPTANGRPKSKTGQMASLLNASMIRKRKGVSVLNPRVKKHVVAQGTVFDSDDDDENDDDGGEEDS
ncbi:hypothetical protein BG004_005997 [Podila humilis]|nr:hypothetical protein BG004_005997 [Podila humilis]